VAQLSTLGPKSHFACLVIDRLKQFEFEMSQSRTVGLGLARAGAAAAGKCGAFYPPPLFAGRF
jgi:hypothetical protein